MSALNHLSPSAAQTHQLFVKLRDTGNRSKHKGWYDDHSQLLHLYNGPQRFGFRRGQRGHSVRSVRQGGMAAVRRPQTEAMPVLFGVVLWDVS